MNPTLFQHGPSVLLLYFCTPVYLVTCFDLLFNTSFMYIPSIISKLQEMILAPFRRQNCLKNLRKNMTFGIDLVDSIFKASDNIYTNCLIYKSLNTICSSLGMLLFSYCIYGWPSNTHLRVILVFVYHTYMYTHCLHCMPLLLNVQQMH